MVGVLIGMIGIIVIFQMLDVSEKRKRTTGAGADAQISGTMALYSLERDLRQAGLGFGMAASSTPQITQNGSSASQVPSTNQTKAG